MKYHNQRRVKLVSEKQINSYYERVEKLLNGANKQTYEFVPEEIRQILKYYEQLQNQIEFLTKRENKLQQIEQMFQNGTVDLAELSKLVKDK